MKNIEDTIKSRHSVRNFIDKQINKDIVDKLNILIKECNNEGNLNIQLILDDGATFDKFILHYGKLQNAKNYLAMIGKKIKI